MPRGLFSLYSGRDGRISTNIGRTSEGNVTDGNKLLRELTGIGSGFWALFLLLSIATFHQDDPSFNQAVSHAKEIHNGAGLLGSFVGGILVDVFGLLSFAWPLLFFHLGLRVFVSRLALPWWRWTGVGMVCVWLMTWLSHPAAKTHISLGHVAGGGFLGDLLYGWSVFLLSPVGAFLLWTFVLVVAGQLLMATTWGVAVAEAGRALGESWARLRRRLEARREKSLAIDLEPQPAAAPAKEKGGMPGFLARLFRRKSGGDEADAAEFAGDPIIEESDDVSDGLLIVGVEPEAPSRSRKKGGGSKAAVLLDAETSPSVANFQAAEAVALAEPEEGDEDDELPFEIDEPALKPIQSQVLSGAKKSGPPPPEGLSRSQAKAVALLAGKLDFPPIDFLAPPPPQSSRVDAAVLKNQAARLTECLSDFSIQGEVQRVTPGPVVTMFEYKPAPGVKISRISGLSDDLTLALRALAVRIEAPIPGKDAVGVEIPNDVRETVWLREILESEEFVNSKSKLTLALGKDIAGQPRVADLARMPHLLVAGATGAGKSVCLNGILLSLLYKASPDEVKLLLIDPKRIELSVYSQLPHLVHPVVTDMALAKNALDWAVYEMDKRYEAMARLGVRNLDGYNQKLEALGADRPADLCDLTPMPYLVLIIDELADLMLTAAKEVETSIVRLAQLARAAGIHLILATQRPSVDVVTGLIKANFPTRISFQVTSKHDSRTILDTVGAEHLLGRGDMLYKPSGSKLQRMHGAYVSEEEIAQVVEFWRAKRQPAFELDFAAWAGDAKGGNGGLDGDGEDLSSDPMYQEALEFVSGQGKASISLLQRRFRIGFNKAARLIEQMERDGLLGPQEGAKPRAVLRGKE